MALGDLRQIQSHTSKRLKQSQLDRIEAKLDALIEALAEDDDQELQFDLDGNPTGGERDQSEAL